MNEAAGRYECTRGEGAGALEGRSVRQGAFTASGNDDFVAGTTIAMYYSSGDPLTRYDRRRFQLVTPSRVASGGVFIGLAPKDRSRPPSRVEPGKTVYGPGCGWLRGSTVRLSRYSFERRR